MDDKGRVIDIGSLRPDHAVGAVLPIENRSKIYTQDILKDLKDHYRLTTKDGQTDHLFDALAEALVKYIDQKRQGGNIAVSFESFSVEYIFPVMEKMRELKMFSEAADLAGLVRGIINKQG